MANEQNLRPPFTPEEAREFGKKGAAASVKARRKKKTIAETVEKILNTKVTDPKQLATIEKVGLPVPKQPTYRDFIVASAIMRSARNGHLEDLTALMAITGETVEGENNREAVQIIDDL